MTWLITLLLLAALLYGGWRWFHDDPIGPGAWLPGRRHRPGVTPPVRRLPRRVAPPTEDPHRWPGRAATPPRTHRHATTRPSAAAERALNGTRFTPPGAICPACSRRLDDCTRPTCLGRGPTPTTTETTS